MSYQAKHEKIVKEIKRLRNLRYTWNQIRDTLFDQNAPTISTLQRWVKGHKSPTPLREMPFPIPSKHKKEVEEVFIRQLRSMGLTSKEIETELKKLIP